MRDGSVYVADGVSAIPEHVRPLVDLARYGRIVAYLYEGRPKECDGVYGLMPRGYAVAVE